MPSEISVRPAQKSDVRALAATLGRAFHDDPVMSWLIPDARLRARGLPRMFALLAWREYLARGGVEVAPNGSAIGATTMWNPPNPPKPSFLDELLMAPAFLWIFRSRAGKGQQVDELMKKVHPKEPHWYLFAIGSDPTVRGGGFGQALMRSRLERCDAEGSPAYLENSNPRNESYYSRFGFEVTGEITLPDGGPSLWPMWRDPR